MIMTIIIINGLVSYPCLENIMKICITATRDNLDADIDPRFGRCSYFLFVDTDSMEWEAVSNTASQSMGGAGVQAGKLMADKNVTALLTGNVGPNAFQTLNAAEVKIITGLSGSVRDNINKFKKNELQTNSGKGPTVDSHFGIKQNR